MSSVVWIIVLWAIRSQLTGVEGNFCQFVLLEVLTVSFQVTDRNKWNDYIWKLTWNCCATNEVLQQRNGDFECYFSSSAWGVCSKQSGIVGSPDFSSDNLWLGKRLLHPAIVRLVSNRALWSQGLKKAFGKVIEKNSSLMMQILVT